jgi:lipid II:glycine glycyltransferase (peptidoglycan interpeptide bridge formation enzyme)
MAEIKLVPDIEWDNFVESSPQGTFLSSIKWMNLYDEPHVTWGYYKGNQLMGGFGGFLKNMPLCAFQGVLIAPTTGKYTATTSLYNEVATALLKDGVLPNEFTNHYTFPDIRPFLWEGYKPTVRYTYVVNLNQELSDLEKQTRYEINHPYHIGTVTKESKDIQFFDALYETTFERKGMKRPITSQMMYSIYETMKGQLFISSDNSTGVMMVTDNKRAYYLFGASDGTSTSSQTVWDALQSMRRQGFAEVDMCGCNNREIGSFKKGFSGKLQVYFGLSR